MEPRERVRALLAEEKMVMLGTLAGKCGISELEAAEALPEEMRAFCGGEKFDEVWSGIVEWPGATFIMQHGGSVIEIQGKIPAGRHGGGYFNLASGCALGGHVRSDAVDRICFLSLPFMGRESHSIQFFDAAGAVLFALYVGRENHELIPAAKEGFLALRSRLGKEAL